MTYVYILANKLIYLINTIENLNYFSPVTLALFGVEVNTIVTLLK
jgi:hypothetical protein